MKIKFSNLGRIKETELDLRPLTVIIGPNNTNKTYIAYSVYGLWRHIGENFTPDEKLDIKQENQHTWSLKIDDSLFDFFVRDAEKLAQTFKGSVLESFFQDSSRKLFSKTSYEIIISKEEFKNAIKDVESLHYLSGDFESDDFKIVEINDILMVKDKNGVTKKDKLQKILMLSLKANIFSNTLPLPAERNGLITSYKILANRRYKLLKEQQRELLTGFKRMELLTEQANIRYPQPVEDFLDFLGDIELEDIPKEKNEFQELADKIEQEIQGGNQVKFKPNQLGGKDLKVRVKKGIEIDLYNASSSIKQITPLILYLRYRAQINDLLVIDEPEMNLHPESQSKLLEALCILVNLGVKVLLTTHSPYIMSHLNNIVSGDQKDPEILERQSSCLYLKDKRAFLSMDQVSPYEMKEDRLESLIDEDYGIRWDTLSDTSFELKQKFFEIYEVGKKRNNEEE